MSAIMLDLSTELKDFDDKPIPFSDTDQSGTTVKRMLLVMIQNRVGKDPDPVTEYALGKLIGESSDTIELDGANLAMMEKIVRESSNSVMIRGQLLEMLT